MSFRAFLEFDGNTVQDEGLTLLMLIDVGVTFLRGPNTADMITQDRRTQNSAGDLFGYKHLLFLVDHLQHTFGVFCYRGKPTGWRG